jgi:peptidylprolyl isomerase
VRVQLPGVSSRQRLIRLLTAACLAAPILGGLAGCGGSASAAELPAVSGAVGEQASISIPASVAPPTKVVSGVLVQGGGAQLADGDAVVVDYTLMDWTGAKLIGSTYGTGAAPDKTQEFVLGSSSALQSWNQVLPRVRVGSRVEIVTPPSGAFGAGGASAYGISGSDDLVYVLDVVGGYPGTADITGTEPVQADRALPAVSGQPGSGQPKIGLPAGLAPPGTLTTKVLVHGSGAALAAGQRLMVQYEGVDWNTGRVFESSFARGQIASFVYGSDGVIPGWNTGLAGAHVGDRVLLVVPASAAYGAKGVPSAGIGGGNTLVFVIDIVDALD